MARPSGKYFATVVNQLRDLKARESIVIDQGFKMRLRSQLMARIDVLQNEQPEKVGFFERLRSLRYHLAVVPMLFFVVATVFAFSKLPVFFQSNVIELTTQVPAQVAQNAISTDQAQPLLETFPGDTVMPAVPKALESANLSQEATSTVVVKPQYAVGENSSTTPLPLINEPVKKTVAPKTIEPQPVAATSASVSIAESVATESIRSSTALDQPVESLSLAIRFDGTFSAGERNLAEHIYIPRLVENKNVNEVEVVQTGMNTVVIRLHNINGAQENYSFRTNSQEGWELVNKF